MSAHAKRLAAELAKGDRIEIAIGGAVGVARFDRLAHGRALVCLPAVSSPTGEAVRWSDYPIPISVSAIRGRAA